MFFNRIFIVFIEIYKIIQFFFDVQWNELKAYANENALTFVAIGSECEHTPTAVRRIF